MFECPWGARYEFNMWTGGCGPPLNGTHKEDTNPKADFSRGHMIFFDMYPLAGGRWFKCSRPTGDGCTWPCDGDLEVTYRGRWSPSITNGCMNNWHRWVDMYERARKKVWWLPGLSCSGMSRYPFKTVLQAWKDTQCPHVKPSESKDPRIYLGYQLAPPGFEGGPCGVCASMVCTSCTSHCKTCNIDVCIDCWLMVPVYGEDTQSCAYGGWEQICPVCKTFFHERYPGPDSYEHNPNYIFFCSDEAEKKGLCKPGCFCKAKPLIQREDGVNGEITLGEHMVAIVTKQKRHVVAMGLHARLGADSILQTMDENLLQMILANELVDRNNMPDRVEPCYD